jgi:hypothetical protein
MPSGQLEKMKIFAYNNAEMDAQHQVGDPFIAMMNPEAYSIDTKMVFNDTQAQGTSGNTPKFELKPPEEMSFEFLFDNTGIIDGSPGENITQKIQDFSVFLMGYDGATHEPKFFKLAWGTLLFKGRCTGLNIQYKLFNPDGAPIRAICKVTFKEVKEENLRVAEENAQSPDLTHYRVVKKGDTLPLMCYLIYGDSRHYLEVARANRLPNFRKLTVGEEIFFPPFSKTSDKNTAKASSR